MIHYGATRLVIPLGAVVVKVASPRYGMRYFLYGCLGNALEWDHWCTTRHPNLAPVHFCAPFGLFTIQRRYKQLLTRPLTEEELEHLPFGNIDNNGKNVAEEGGQLVLVDYSNCDFFWKLPTPWGRRVVKWLHC